MALGPLILRGFLSRIFPTSNLETFFVTIRIDLSEPLRDVEIGPEDIRP
jgi:hypothetical protein